MNADETIKSVLAIHPGYEIIFEGALRTSLWFCFRYAVCYYYRQNYNQCTVAGDPAAVPVESMKKLGLILLLIFVLGLVIFSTWQLYAGNLTAAFSTLPFLLITYLFIMRLKP
jgi:hypothetical protein